jgi:hypothetical protein
MKALRVSFLASFISGRLVGEMSGSAVLQPSGMK